MSQPSAPSTDRSLPGWLLVPGAVLFAGSLAAVAALATFGGYDLSVYLLGGEAFRHGLPVYDQQVHSQWGAGYFTYPPVTLLLFAPLSSLPHTAAYGMMFVLEIAVLLVVVWLTLHLLGHRPGRGGLGVALGCAGAALWLQPVFDSVDEGKLELILMALVLADFALAGRRRWPAGVLVGLAAALKITPGIFIVFLLLTRRYRAAVTAAVTWAAVTAVGFAAAPADSVRFWFEGTFADSDRVASPLTVDTVFNQSLHGVAVRLLGDRAAPGWYVVALVVAAGGLAAAVAADRSHGRLAGVLACALTGLLISPVSWHEHWVWMVPALIFLGDGAWRAWPRARARSAVLGAAVPGLAGVFLMWPLPTGEPGGWAPASVLSPANHAWFDEGSRHPVVAVVGAAYVIVGGGLLATAAWTLRRNCRISVSSPIGHLRRVLGAARPG